MPANTSANLLACVAAALLLIGHILPGLRLGRIFIFASASAGIGALGVLLAIPLPIYGSLPRSCTATSLGLIWLADYRAWQGSVSTRLIGFSILWAALGWLPEVNAVLPTLQGALPVLAQLFYIIALGLWLYSASLGGDDASPIPLPVLACIFQAGSSLLVAANAVVTWGQPFTFDPLESWWLFASITAGIAAIGARRGWPLRAVLAVGMLPALGVWFASWSVIQALHVPSLYGM